MQHAKRGRDYERLEVHVNDGNNKSDQDIQVLVLLEDDASPKGWLLVLLPDLQAALD